MARLSGYEVLERLAANPVTGAFLSSYDFESARRKGASRNWAQSRRRPLKFCSGRGTEEAKIEEALFKAGVEKPKERI